MAYEIDPATDENRAGKDSGAGQGQAARGKPMDGALVGDVHGSTGMGALDFESRRGNTGKIPLAPVFPGNCGGMMVEAGQCRR